MRLHPELSPTSPWCSSPRAPPTRTRPRQGRARAGGLRQQALRARRPGRDRAPTGRGAARAVIEERLLELVQGGARDRGARARVRRVTSPNPSSSRTKQKEHGDFATNVALVLASKARSEPARGGRDDRRAFPDAPFVERVEVAGPGFLNIFVTDAWLHDALREVVVAGFVVRRRRRPPVERVQVEFVELQPHGSAPRGSRAQRDDRRRAGVAAGARRAGRSSASTTSTTPAGRWTGSAASVEARYLQLLGREAELPEDGYRGDYVAGHRARHPGERRSGRRRPGGGGTVRSSARPRCPADPRGDRSDARTVRRALRRRIGPSASWRERARSTRRSHRLRDAGYIYEDDGAVWFRSTAFGDDKDRVVIRSQRRPHVLRGGLRLRDRQVLPRLRSPDLRVGSRSPRRCRPGEGRGPGAGLRSEARRDRPVPVGGVPARRRARQDEHARRRVRHARRS